MGSSQLSALKFVVYIVIENSLTSDLNFFNVKKNIYVQAIPAFSKKKKSMTTNVIHLIIFNKINSFNNIIKKTLKVNKTKKITIINYKK